MLAVTANSKEVLYSIDYSISIIDGKVWYILNKEFTYFSKRYGKYVTVPKGTKSDGASFIASDIIGIAWWVHDRICVTKCFDDGTKITALQSSLILYDCLYEQKQRVRAIAWFIFVFPYQYLFGEW